jgi:CRISPR/Cas system-associated protein Csx1
MRRSLPYLLMIILLSCNNREKEMNDVLAFKEMNELATVEYVVTKIVKAEDNQTWYKFGDRKILMSCEASIKAGIDFSNINEGDITIEGKSISLVLPKAHFISMNIKPEDVRVEYVETGLFRDDFTTSERDALLAQGEKQIRNSTEALGVIAAAEANASLFISNYLKMLGYNRINIRFSKDPIPQLK